MRTALTALGLIIGVAAVIVMVAIGNGARSSIESRIRSAGTNVGDHLRRLERIRTGPPGQRPRRRR
jgi:ABC-type antimicrobial peptide transport system permease subunit